MKKIAILGSTGSIGTQALDIIEKNPELYQVTVLSCESRIDDLSRQIEKFKPLMAVVAREKDALQLRKMHPGVDIAFGMEGLIEAAESEYDLLLNALVGMVGLQPTHRAIQKGKDIALANKETLVAGGALIMEAVRQHKVRLLPVDSEHSAIFQCLQGNEHNEVQRLILTASGGPFRNYSMEQLEQVTLEQALRHPKWTMGRKITIDSATMMNKGLEVIEAHWLFDMPGDKIQIAVHPQSIVHSMVEYVDHSMIAQLGVPDMRIPISYAFSYPDRIPFDEKGLDIFGEGASLTFEKVDMEVFQCVSYAYEALKQGGSYPVVLNAANETLVGLFLENKIKYIDIQRLLGIILDRHVSVNKLDMDSILGIDQEARTRTLELVSAV